jgi:hypothetical protein
MVKIWPYLKSPLEIQFFFKAHVLEIFTNDLIYMDFIGSYLSHNYHLTHNIKIDYQFNIIKWIVWIFTCAKIGPLIHPFI